MKYEYKISYGIKNDKNHNIHFNSNGAPGHTRTQVAHKTAFIKEKFAYTSVVVILLQ